MKPKKKFIERNFIDLLKGNTVVHCTTKEKTEWLSKELKKYDSNCDTNKMLKVWEQNRAETCYGVVYIEGSHLDFFYGNYRDYLNENYKIFELEDLFEMQHRVNCNITKIYFKERKRMTNNCDYDSCKDCVLNTTDLDCKDFEIIHTDEAVGLVQEWSDSHPYKTYKEDFIEKFPQINLVRGYPELCPCQVYPSLKTKGCSEESESCRECWDSEMEV